MTDTTELAIPEDIRFVAADTGEEVRRFPVAPQCTRSMLGGRTPHPTRQVWSQFEPEKGTSCYGWSPKQEETVK